MTYLHGILAQSHIRTAEVVYDGETLEVPREVLPIDKQLSMIADEWRVQWAAGQRHRGRHKYRLLVNAPRPDGGVTFRGCEKCGKPELPASVIHDEIFADDVWQRKGRPAR